LPVGAGLVIVAQNLVIVLCREIEPGRGIPIEAGLVLLPKQIEILNPWQTLPFCNLILVDVARLLLPVTPEVKEPVVNAGVTQLQRLGEGVEVFETVDSRWYRGSRTEGCIEVNRVALLILPRITEGGEHGQIL